MLLKSVKLKRHVLKPRKNGKKNKLKRLKAAGQPYVSRANKYSEFKLRPGKKRKPRSCKCRYTQCAELSEEELESIFKKFYSLGSHNDQKFNILQNVEDNPKKRSNEENQKNKNIDKRRSRKYSRKYYLNGKVVCKELFMNTFCVSSAQIHRLIKKRKEGEGVITSIDRRGKHNKQVRISEEIKNDIKAYIAKFPKYSSHYGREKDSNNMLTLAPGITKQSLYEHFIEETQYKVSKEWFLKFMRENIPVQIYKPHIDTCDICNDNTISFAEKKEHKEFAYSARKEMKKDPAAITFDLQKAHALPLLTTNKAYYKHQLVIFNQGVHDTKHNQGYSHLWSENLARRGSREIASVIYRFVTLHCQDRETLSFWCDNCTGLFRNIFF